MKATRQALAVRAAAWVVIASAVSYACAPSQAADACEPGADGIAVATGPADVQGLRTARLEELWRVGGDREDQQFAMPVSFAVNERGDLAVVDHGLAEVVVITGQGEWLGSWAERGRGPGELVMPVAASWSGDDLAVFDIVQAKISLYGPGGVLEHELRVPAAFAAPVVNAGEIQFVALRSDGSVLLQYPLTIQTDGPASISVLMLRPGEDGPDTLVTTEVGFVDLGRSGRLVAPGWPVPRVAVAANGWLAIASANGSYRVEVRDSLDQAIRQLCRPVEPLELSEAERGNGDQPADVAAILAGLREPAVRASVGRLLIGPAGEVWVDRRRPAPMSPEVLHGVAGSRLDVFDASGAFRGEVMVPDDVSIQAVSGDRAWGLEFGEYDEPWIIAYRVVWDDA
jgi:hypothetical protein